MCIYLVTSDRLSEYPVKRARLYTFLHVKTNSEHQIIPFSKHYVYRSTSQHDASNASKEPRNGIRYAGQKPS